MIKSAAENISVQIIIRSGINYSCGRHQGNAATIFIQKYQFPTRLFICHLPGCQININIIETTEFTSGSYKQRESAAIFPRINIVSCDYPFSGKTVRISMSGIIENKTS